MKKYVASLLFLLLILTGCGTKSKTAQYMDKPADDGKYYYNNKDMGFSIVFPKEFIYYQTQRVTNDGFIDMEYFIPTSDESTFSTLSGYAKPVVIRIFDKDKYKEINGDIFEKIAEKNNKVYTIKFWDKVPSDWKDKWNDDLKNEIKKSFKNL